MGRTSKTLLALAVLFVAAADLAAQAGEAPIDAYVNAVAEFFEVPVVEIEILRESRLADEEIPVVLFFASRAGVSAEALVGLRRSGTGWSELSRRYGVGADALHLPVPDAAPAGPLEALYASYRATPVSEWRGIALSAGDIVVLVNVRLLSQTLNIPPAEILQRVGNTTSFVELYASLIR